MCNNFNVCVFNTCTSGKPSIRSQQWNIVESINAYLLIILIERIARIDGQMSTENQQKKANKSQCAKTKDL